MNSGIYNQEFTIRNSQIDASSLRPRCLRIPVANLDGNPARHTARHGCHVPCRRCVPFASPSLSPRRVVPLAAPRPPTLPAETLLDRAVLDALDQELSGVAAKDHVVAPGADAPRPCVARLSRGDRVRDGRARKAFGLSDVHVETFPGRRHDLVRHAARQPRLARRRRHARRSAAAAAPHHQHRRRAACGRRQQRERRRDRGARRRRQRQRSATDYDGKDVRGKLVLCDATPGVCHRLAVEEHGAAGLVSYNSNQPSAWWRDDQDLIRWGHLDARGRQNTFAIMISLREARALQQRLAARRAHHAARGRPRAQRRCVAVRNARGDDSRLRSVRRRHRLQLPPRSREAGRERQRQRLLGEPRDRADAEDADRREAHSAAGPDDPFHLAVGDDRHDRVSDEVPGDRRPASARPCTSTWSAAIRSSRNRFCTSRARPGRSPR